MSAFDKIADKLPDVYFDWYARLLPGIAGILAFFIKGTGTHQRYISEHIF